MYDLGFATANLLSSEGCKVVICARREDYLKEKANQIMEESKGLVHPVVADVSKAEDCKKLVDITISVYKSIDILVNNAGTSAAFGIQETNDKIWQDDLELKVMASVRLSRAVIPLMKKNGGGSIINASIGDGKTPTAKCLPTSLSRAAGINLTKSLANEFAKDQIRVNAICIGLIKSAQWERWAGRDGIDALYNKMSKEVPLGRMGEAEEFANLVAFLASTKGSYITGTAINLDGGICPVT